MIIGNEIVCVNNGRGQCTTETKPQTHVVYYIQDIQVHNQWREKDLVCENVENDSTKHVDETVQNCDVLNE